jgi:uncharacterized phiE125 gp8 family phage protein
MLHDRELLYRSEIRGDLTRRAPLIVRVTGEPAEEPVTVAEAKAHLRIDVDTEDSLLTGYLLAAREQCELLAKRAFVTQTIQLRLEMWPYGDVIPLPRPPLQSVTSIVYTDSDGNATTMPSADYIVDSASEPGRVILGYAGSWPSVTLQPGPSIVITYVAGYGDAEDVPQRYKQAIELLAGHFFENREEIVVMQGVSMAQLPIGVKALLGIDRGWYG